MMRHVAITSDEYFECAVALFEKHGFKWWNPRGKFADCQRNLPLQFVVNTTTQTIDWNRAGSRAYSWLALTDLDVFLEAHKEPEVLVDGHVMEFRSDGSIKIGCQTLPYRQVSEIWRRVQKKRSEGCSA